jgi:hypothetical protein
MLVYSLTIIAFFVTGRYRVPLLPFISMGAALTIVQAVDLARAKRFAHLMMVTAATVALVVGLSIDHLNVRGATRGFVELTQAQDLLATGDLDGAIQTLETIRGTQSVSVPDVYISLARALIERSLPDDGDRILKVAEEGLSYYPDDPELLWYASMGNVAKANWEQAEDRIGRFLTQRPDDMRGLHLAFVIALTRGKSEQAGRMLSRAQAIDDHHPLVVDMQQRLESIER